MVQYIGIVTFAITLIAIALLLTAIAPSMKKEKVQHVEDGIKYIGFGKRLLAFMIDFGIHMFLVSIIGYIVLVNVNLAQLSHMILYEIMRAVLLYIAVAFFIVKLGGTPGKLLLKIRIVSIHGGNLSFRSAFLRQSFSIVSTFIQIAVIYFSASMVSMFDMIVRFGDYSNFYEFQWDLKLIILASLLITIVSLVDYLTMFKNKRKRTLHDFLAESIVVHHDTIPNTTLDAEHQEQTAGQDTRVD